MNARKILIGLTLWCLAAGASFAAGGYQEVWKLDEAKSTLIPGMPKDQTLTYTITGQQVRIVADGVAANGKPRHTVWTGMYDGKDHPVKGDPASDARAYRVAGDRELAVTVKKGGKTVATGKVTVARGTQIKTVVLTYTGTDDKTAVSTAVYERK